MQKRCTSHAPIQELSWGREWDWIPVSGRVRVLPPQVVQSRRWRNVITGSWHFDQPIHVKESRVETMGLRYVCRSRRFHSCVLLTLGDNLSSVLSHEKARARYYCLRSSVSVGSAYLLACNVPWMHRYIISEMNPTDSDSRLITEKNVKSVQPSS